MSDVQLVDFFILTWLHFSVMTVLLTKKYRLFIFSNYSLLLTVKHGLFIPGDDSAPSTLKHRLFVMLEQGFWALPPENLIKTFSSVTIQKILSLSRSWRAVPRRAILHDGNPCWKIWSREFSHYSAIFSAKNFARGYFQHFMTFVVTGIL